MCLAAGLRPEPLSKLERFPDLLAMRLAASQPVGRRLEPLHGYGIAEIAEAGE